MSALTSAKVLVVDDEPDACTSLRRILRMDSFESEQRKHVFQPFFTTKAKGTGLGMAIAKRIVDAHGGNITVGVAS